LQIGEELVSALPMLLRVDFKNWY